MNAPYLFLIGLSLTIALGYVPTAIAQSNALETQVIIDPPTHDDLYLQNDRINVTINFVNHGNETILVDYSFEIKAVEAATPVADIPSATASIQPNGNLPYSIPRVYSAGNYQIYATANIHNSTSDDDDRKEFFFWVATPLELYSKQALGQNQELLKQNRDLAQFTLYGVYAAIAIAITSIIAVVITHYNNKTVREDTNRFAEQQLQLMQASNQELKESNMLTRLSMDLSKDQIKAAIHEPIVTIVNLTPEITGRTKVLRLFPNFRNDGEVALRNTKIYYKVMDEVVELKEIVAQEQDIRESVIDVPGTIISGAPINLHDRGDDIGIPFPKSGTKSVVVWFTYNYFEEFNSETVFDLRYDGIMPLSKSPIRYTKIDIEQARGSLLKKPS